jgi:hypothetical protein
MRGRSTPSHARDSAGGNAAKQDKTRGGRLFLLLYSLPFTLVGLGMLFLAVIPNLYDWTRMQAWEQIDAQLISAELKSHPGDKSTTYEVVAAYRYLYQGQGYQGHRVGISEKSDNIGNWHQQTYSRLRNMQPLRVWVNPSDPNESVFDRELRWGKLGFYMIFVLVFGGAGLGIGWLSQRKPLEIPAGVPVWEGNPAWRDNRIRSNAKAGMWTIWAFAFFWNLISSPVIFAVPGEWDKGNHAILIALLFPLVGLGMIIYAAKRTLEWRHFGAAPLSLDPFPGSIGGDVGGSIRVNQRLPHNAQAEVILSCVYVYSRRSGKSRETVRDVKWQDRQQVRIEAAAQDSLIRFRFAVPDNLPSSEVKAMPYYEWTVEVSSDLPGVDLERSYTLPVAAGEAAQHSTHTPIVAPHSARQAAIPERVMQLEQRGDGLHLHFPVMRNKAGALIGTLVGALFVGMAWLFAFGEMRKPPPAIFPIVFGLLGNLALLGGLYTMGNSLTVVANRRGVQVTRRIFGLALRKRIPSAQIKSIRTVTGMQTSQGGKTTVHYTVKLHTRDGRKISVAESLPGVSAAEQVAEQIRSACDFSERDASERLSRRGDGKYGMDDLAGEILEKRKTIGRATKWISNIVGLAMIAYFVSRFLSFS